MVWASFDLWEQAMGKLSYSYALNLLVAFRREVKQNQTSQFGFTKEGPPDTKESTGAESA
jgi:hypothetical protein